MSNNGNNLHEELEKAQSKLIKLREMNQEAEDRAEKARDKIVVLQALFHSLKQMSLYGDDYDNFPYLLFGLDEIIRGIKCDLDSAINGGLPCELGEYSLEDLEREIESRKMAPEPKPASDNSEADE